MRTTLTFRNGVALVDDDWFKSSVAEIVLDVPVRRIPSEEMIWSKSFVMERERYDGADVAHVLQGRPRHDGTSSAESRVTEERPGSAGEP